MMKTRKGEQSLLIMRMEVMTRVIVVVTAVAMIVDMMMMTTTATVRATIVKTMIVNTVAMIRVNPLVIEKLKTQIFSMKNMMMMWTTMIKILKMMPKLTGEVTLIVTNTG